MNILIIKMSAIGDVVHTLPALCALRDYYPSARITWLVEESAADIVLGHKALDRVIISRRKTWIRELFSKKYLSGAKKILRFLGILRDIRYDIIIDFQGLLKSGIMVFLARGKRKIGFGKGMEHAEMSHLFYNERVPAVSMEVHAQDRYLMLLKASGIPVSCVRYDLPVSDKERKSIRKKLVKTGIPSNHSLICINPVATWPTKLWINRRFAEIVAELQKWNNTSVIFTGAYSDRGMIEDILGILRPPDAGGKDIKNWPINFAGRTTLKELAALYEISDLLITTDTGPMHLGVASGTRVLAILGPTAPWRTGPYGKDHIVIRAQKSCSPCFKRSCPLKTHACMFDISTDKVWESIIKIFPDQVSQLRENQK